MLEASSVKAAGLSSQRWVNSRPIRLPDSVTSTRSIVGTMAPRISQIRWRSSGSLSPICRKTLATLPPSPRNVLPESGSLPLPQPGGFDANRHASLPGLEGPGRTARRLRPGSAPGDSRTGRGLSPSTFDSNSSPSVRRSNQFRRLLAPSITHCSRNTAYEDRSTPIAATSIA